jgi:hypothetical protein
MRVFIEQRIFLLKNKKPFISSLLFDLNIKEKNNTVNYCLKFNLEALFKQNKTNKKV